jgi:hypothetical protein
MGKGYIERRVRVVCEMKEGQEIIDLWYNCRPESEKDVRWYMILATLSERLKLPIISYAPDGDDIMRHFMSHECTVKKEYDVVATKRCAPVNY